ncbi:MAG: thiamine-phosphate kinase [Candidatus Bathyarchaeia archaeon]
MVSEREIIQIIRGYLKESPRSTTPFGDDVSTLRVEGRLLAVVKVDMFVRETDAVPGMSLSQMARKAIVSTVSDFASKGVQPLALMSSMALPPSVSSNDVAELASGLCSAAEEYGTYVVGGDTNQASDLIIDIAGFGLAEEPIMSRSDARPGDILATTGTFGETAASFKILFEGLTPPDYLKIRLLESVYEPKAHLKQGIALKESMCINASIDSSDGLAWSIHELSVASGVGFQLTSIPISEDVLRFAEMFHLDPYQLALYGGEEYNLVVTVKRSRWKEAVKAVENAKGRLHKMGEAVEAPGIFLSTNGGRRKVQPIGWEHLKERRHRPHKI